MKIQTTSSFFVLYFLCFCLGLGFGNMSNFGRIMLAFAYSERMIIGRISTGSDMPLFLDSMKLRIKSLKVPDLRIEIPATATVGSLKVCDTPICDFLFFHFGFMLLPYYVYRMVMEAMIAVLGDGLHVGIRLQGKRVRDDTKTLLQTWICHGDKRHRLGVLEPKHVHITPPSHSNDCPLLSDGTSQGLTG
ncbi:hypothetical protein WN943_003991 [Citrus x changshan-huyou]